MPEVGKKVSVAAPATTSDRKTRSSNTATSKKLQRQQRQQQQQNNNNAAALDELVYQSNRDEPNQTSSRRTGRHESIQFYLCQRQKQILFVSCSSSVAKCDDESELSEDIRFLFSIRISVICNGDCKYCNVFCAGGAEMRPGDPHRGRRRRRRRPVHTSAASPVADTIGRTPPPPRGTFASSAIRAEGERGTEREMPRWRFTSKRALRL